MGVRKPAAVRGPHVDVRQHVAVRRMGELAFDRGHRGDHESEETEDGGWFGNSRRSKTKCEGLPKNKLFMLKNNNHSRSVGGRGRWLPPPSNFVVELILYIINQVFLCKCIWN